MSNKLKNGNVRVAFYVKPETHKRFGVACRMERKLMSEVVETLLAEYASRYEVNKKAASEVAA